MRVTAFIFLAVVPFLSLLGSTAARPLHFQGRNSDTHSWTPVGAEPSGADAVKALANRRLPKKWRNRFDFVETVCPLNSTSYDAFTVDAGKKRITISSCTTSGLSRGLLTYLRSIGGDIYWSGDNLHLLPSSACAPCHLEGAAWGPIRYFLNVVTYSYTTAFYQWDKWEYLLDWAALHGVNLPLAIGGQEYVWAEVFRDFGLDDKTILDYFSGPAFLSWQRMGNIHASWGRNITQDWLDKQWDLQKKIISRMVALGMDPVLPGFSGFVPRELQDHIGGPEFLTASAWEGFPVTRNAALDPTWETYHTVQAAFLQKQQDLYGGWTSHYYSIDLYNELKPSSTAPDYLHNVASNVTASLRAIDDDAVWVMQGWLFASDPQDWTPQAIEAFVHGAQQDELLILDLASESKPVWNRTENFYGRPWVWNTLFNYGQNSGMNGNLEQFNAGVMAAKETGGALLGTGITMEGMNQNEIIYEMALDTIWQTTEISVPSWTHDWVERRYSLETKRHIPSDAKDLVQSAWSYLLRSAYNQTDPAVEGVSRSIFGMVPRTTSMLNRTGHHPTKLAFDTGDVVKALDDMIAAAEKAPLEKVEAFGYDFVDVARQVLLTAGIPLYQKMIAAWNTSTPNPETISTTGKQIVHLMRDVDSVLATNKNFLLSTWIKDARSWADDGGFMEYQARNQIVLWGPATYAPWPLDRYAAKDWHGVVGDVFGTSWEMFYEHLLDTPVESYNATTWAQTLQDFEATWETQTWGEGEGQTWGTVGTPLETIKRVRGKWAWLVDS